MAQPGINAKIEELQFRIKTDPKSRLFFPLAEELRKNGRLPEAEQVLRTGLGVHATYLSAWVSLGRVLREQGKNAGAVDALTTALQVDPGNVVAARLLADAYLDLGEKVEAIKKYKLVHALMPSDEELEAKIERLDRELQAAAPEPFAPVEQAPEAPFAEPEPEPAAEPEPALAPSADTPFAPAAETPFDETTPISRTIETPPISRTIETPFDTGDEIPMAAHHAESPFEDPSGYTSDAVEIEQPVGIHVEEAPPAAAEVPSVWLDEPKESESAADVFAPAESDATAQDDDVTATTTMADLYVRQGLIDEARKIYEHVLQRDPSDEEVRSKLDALNERVAAVPGHQSAESPAFEAQAATSPPGDAATEPPASAWQPVIAAAISEEAGWQPGSEPAAEEAPPQPGNPATLHGHARVVALEQWLARVSRKGQGGA
ncbi:MAG TPA: tetratricopeptide repeat protein [Thermoanaerobaculia bacterium]|nr:tetratricopeptide repeat protein [Thermoanaerobaculia bacterium]